MLIFPTQIDPLDEQMSLGQAAAELGRARATVQAFLLRGVLPFSIIAGRVFVTRRDVLALKAKHPQLTAKRSA